jgi:isopentenyl-diphosphate Delta-isomerase
MTEVTIESRKADHIRINLEQNVQFPRLTTGLEAYRFLHNALPELDLHAIDTQVTLLGKRLAVPLLVSSMTGGTDMALQINRRLAQAAQAHGIAMGLGSMRAALKQPETAHTFQLRDLAPDVLLLANVGAVQLNYGYGRDQCRQLVDIAGADALILHFNVLQEAVQPEGDVNFADLLRQIEALCRTLGVPVVAKEVGWGFAPQNVRDLINAGVAAVDVAGAGGTSWSEVEYHRAPTAFHARVAASFADWGIPTADALLYAKEGAAHSGAPHTPIIASGGLRDGIDVAKCIALGACVGGMAGPFLKAADQSYEAVDQLIRETVAQLRIAMLCSGAADIAALQRTPLLRA